MRILGIDPGVTTGMALIQADSRPENFSPSEDKFAMINSMEISSQRLYGGEALAIKNIAHYIVSSHAHHIVIEDFVLRSDARQQDRTLLAPVRITSAVLGFLQGLGLVYGGLEALDCWEKPLKPPNKYETEKSGRLRFAYTHGREDSFLGIHCAMSELLPIHFAEIHFQQPSMAKTTVTDERLRRWGGWVKGEKHSRDAARHAMTFYLRQQ